MQNQLFVIDVDIDDDDDDDVISSKQSSDAPSRTKLYCNQNE